MEESVAQVAALRETLDRTLAAHAAERREARAAQQELLAQIATLSEQVARANDRISELLAIAQRKKRPEKKNEPKAKPPPPDLPDDVREAFENRPRPPVVPDKPKKLKSEAKPTGRQPLPPHLGKEEHALSPDRCTCGCTAFDFVDEVVEEKLTVVKEHQRRRVVRRKTGRCRHCRKRTTARSLPAPFPRSKVTCEWMAWLVVQKFVQLTPLDRVRDLLHLQGIPLSMSFLVSQVQRAAGLLDAIDGVHWAQLLAGDWMTHDATPLAVVVDGVPGTHKGHIEVFQRSGLVVLQYEHDKKGETLATKLRRFKGTLVADAEHRHNATFADGTILEAGCNAHGERKLEAAESSQPVLAAEGRTYIRAIFAADAEAHRLKLEGPELLAWRKERIAPLYEEFAAWRDSVLPTLLPDEPLAGVLRYYQNHWTALTRWVGDPKLPPDNSASERVFQRVAKLRLACLFAGSTEGAHTLAVLMGLSATCRNIGVDPQAWFTWALERRGTHADVYGMQAHQLTPAAYKATLTA
ncbi:MAG: IS66 family transposase [Myxococcales bacterium]|nr:IS66 family transposase [Myxococcales bacterium]